MDKKVVEDTARDAEKIPLRLSCQTTTEGET